LITDVSTKPAWPAQILSAADARDVLSPPEPLQWRLGRPPVDELALKVVAACLLEVGWRGHDHWLSAAPGSAKTDVGANEQGEFVRRAADKTEREVALES